MKKQLSKHKKIAISSAIIGSIFLTGTVIAATQWRWSKKDTYTNLLPAEQKNLKNALDKLNSLNVDHLVTTEGQQIYSDINNFLAQLTKDDQEAKRLYFKAVKYNNEHKNQFSILEKIIDFKNNELKKLSKAKQDTFNKEVPKLIKKLFDQNVDSAEVNKEIQAFIDSLIKSSNDQGKSDELLRERLDALVSLNNLINKNENMADALPKNDDYKQLSESVNSSLRELKQLTGDEQLSDLQTIIKKHQDLFDVNLKTKTTLDQNILSAVDALKVEIQNANEELVKPENNKKDNTAISQVLRDSYVFLIKTNEKMATETIEQTKKLAQAIADFKAQQPVANEQSFKDILTNQLDKLIANATSVVTANETAGVTDENLKTQLTKANEAKTNIESQTPEQLKTVVENLVNALNTANAKLNKHTKDVIDQKNALNNANTKAGLDQQKTTAVNALKDQINAADTALADQSNANKETTGISKALRDALDTLVNVDTTSTVDVNAKTEELKKAIETFKAQTPISTNNQAKDILESELDKLIANATSVVTANETAGVTDENLKTQLTKANEAKTNIESQSLEQLKTVVENLVNALNTANAKLNKHTKDVIYQKNALNNAIKQAETMKNELPNSSDAANLKTKIDQDIAAAKTVVDKPNATLEELTTAKQTLDNANTANANTKAGLDQQKTTAVNALKDQINAADTALADQSNANKETTGISKALRDALDTLVNVDTTSTVDVNAKTEELKKAIETFKAQTHPNTSDEASAKYKDLLVENLTKLLANADIVATANTENKITDVELTSKIAAAKNCLSTINNQSGDQIVEQIGALTTALNNANQKLNTVTQKKQVLNEQIQAAQELLKSLQPNADFENLKTLIEQTITEAQSVLNGTEPTDEKLQAAIDVLTQANAANVIQKEKLENTHNQGAQNFKQAYDNAVDFLVDTSILDTPERQALLALKSEEQSHYLNPKAVSSSDLQTKTQTLNSAVMAAKIASGKKAANDLLGKLGNDNQHADAKNEITNALNELNSLAENADEATVNQALNKLKEVVAKNKSVVENVDNTNNADNTTLINNFNTLKQEAEQFIVNDISEARYDDIKKLLESSIEQNNAIVNPTDGHAVSSQEILLAQKDLEKVLDQIKLKKQIRDLQAKNTDVAPPTEYLDLNKSKQDILVDYEKFLNEARETFLQKTAELSGKYQSEVVPGDEEYANYPKSYKEMNDPSNPEDTNNKRYLKYIVDELAWVSQQKQADTTTNQELVRKINFLFRKRYNNLLQMNLEEKIERTRTNLRMFVVSLDKNKYNKLIEWLISKLRQVPNSNTTKPLIFSANSTLVELEAININLNTILNAVPGEIAKADFKEQVAEDLSDFIPSIAAFYNEDQDNTIDAASYSWITLLQSEKISELRTKSEQYRDEIDHIDSVNFIAIREKINQFALLKKPYIKAYYDAMEYHINKHIEKIKEQKIGDIDINNLSTFFDNVPKTDTVNQKIQPLITTIKEAVKTMQLGFEDIKKIPTTIGPNLLHTRTDSRATFEKVIESKYVSFDQPIEKINQVINSVKQVLVNHYNELFTVFHETDQAYNKGKNANSSLVRFISEIQNGRTVDEAHPDINNIFTQYTNKINKSINSNAILSSKLKDISSIVQIDKIFKDNFDNYAKEYYTKTMEDEAFKTEMKQLFVKNNITYLLGVYDSKADNGCTSWQYGGSALDDKGSSFTLGQENEYGSFGNDDSVGLRSINYLNDLSLLLNDESKIKTQNASSDTTKYAYALFIYKQNKDSVSDYYTKIISDTKLRLPKDLGDKRNVISYYVSSLLSQSGVNRYVNNYGLYEMIDYALLGLTMKYESKYREINPNTTLDTQYIDASTHNLKDDSNLSPIQLAHKALDIFGVNVWKHWAGFSNFDKEKLYFNAVQVWDNSHDIAFNVRVGKISTNQNINFPSNGVQIQRYDTHRNETIIPNSMVNSSIWMDNAKNEMLKAYEKLYLAYMDLLQNSNQNNPYVLVNKNILGRSSRKVNFHKEIDKTKLQQYEHDPKINSQSGFVYFK
ncbi:hypothetical protein OF375_02050 [Ureaplasma miroungigenitalium]|uniref:hypothetical protein n=1 Tax=Ureaplasma miroungigenitalium TaxID=1042321 RepID=UPI0021E70C26|nr:hypothetical protein [Ureaplasma miroungigenitalium]MCV3734348.1 hypothetical protein [Ureaplasma miroungigenitalium]